MTPDLELTSWPTSCEPYQAERSHICWSKLYKQPLPHKLHSFLTICVIFRSGSQGSRSRRKRPKYAKLLGFSFWKEVLLLCLFGMTLPTVDVYSDGALIIQLYTDTTQNFRCLSNGKVIPAGYVKDEYRTCSDESDERGKKTILITNSTYIGTYVLSFYLPTSCVRILISI